MLSAKDNCRPAAAGSPAKKRRTQGDRWLQLRNSGLCPATSTFGAPSHCIRAGSLDRALSDGDDRGVSLTDVGEISGEERKRGSEIGFWGSSKGGETSDKVCYVN